MDYSATLHCYSPCIPCYWGIVKNSLLVWKSNKGDILYYYCFRHIPSLGDPVLSWQIEHSRSYAEDKVIGKLNFDENKAIILPAPLNAPGLPK